MTEARRVFFDNDLGDKAAIMYRKRRRLLSEKLGHPFVFRGIDSGPKGEHIWSVLDSYVFQDPLILYYSGLNQSGVAIYVDPILNEEILFLPKKDRHLEFWEGFQLGVDNGINDIKKLTGFRQIELIDDIDSVLLDKIKGFKRQSRFGCFWHQSKKSVKKDHHYRFKKLVQTLLTQSNRKGLSLVNIQEFIWDQCLVMDLNDQRLLREANQLTRRALQVVRKALPNMKTEHAVSSLLHYELNRRSVHGLSFAPIVASGKNATVLHYTQNDSKLDKKGLLLLDFGCRRYALCADQSYTIPVSGTANALQRLLLRIVKQAQDKVTASVKPGVFLDDLNAIAWDFINQSLDKKILKKGGDMELPYQEKPHGVSHMIGYQVHDGDPFRMYASRPLKPGMCISNEPGIYGYFDLTIQGKRYREWIGIRLEVDLLVTKDGCEIL